MAKEPLIKIIPKPKPKPPFLVNFLFWLACFLFPFLILSFFFLGAKISALEKEKKILEKNLAPSTLEKELEKEVSLLSQKIKDFSHIWQEHKITFNFLNFLKSLAHPHVQFLSLEMEAKNYRVTLSGKAENFQVLAQQLLALKESKEIKNLKTHNIALDREGKVTFLLTFSFQEDLIKR